MSRGLVIDGVTVGRPGDTLLRDVHLEIPPGHVVLVTGPNGAGTSTLLQLIAGSTVPRSGTVTIGGEPPDRRRVAAVPHGRKLFPSLSVLENLRVAADAWQVPRPRFEAALAEVGERFPQIWAKRDHPAGTLSGGQQQLLAIARAHLGNPEVIVLDEPSMGLSPVTWKEVAAGLAASAEAGVIVVLAEQRLRLAFDLADRVVVLVGGAITVDAARADLSVTDVERAALGRPDR